MSKAKEKRFEENRKIAMELLLDRPELQAKVVHGYRYLDFQTQEGYLTFDDPKFKQRLISQMERWGYPGYRESLESDKQTH